MSTPSPTPRMRKVIQTGYGGTEVLRLVEAERPAPGPGEVLVRVHGSGVNPADWKTRAGIAHRFAEPPFTPGLDLAGVVETAGDGVTGFRPGDRVFAMVLPPRGAQAEYVVVPAGSLGRLPDGIDLVHAAALPTAGLTAWQSVVRVAGVRPGQRVLVHAAAGGVGHLAVQFAKARGAYVIGTARERNHAFVRGLGADEVIDYRTTDFTEAVTDVDLVLDTVGGDTGHRSIAALRPGGLLVTIVDRADAALKQATVTAGRRFTGVTVEPDHVGLQALAALADAGQLRPYVEHTLPLAEAPKAHALIESGRTQGKIVLTV